MWIFLNDAFLSIVADRHSDKLLVRARIPGDIERAFPTAEVIQNNQADYLYRAWIDREQVANLLSQWAQNIRYSNFKNSIKDHARHLAYLDVWEVMQAVQES